MVRPLSSSGRHSGGAGSAEEYEVKKGESNQGGKKVGKEGEGERER